MAISSSNQKLIFIIYFFFLFSIFTKTLAVNAEESAQCQSESGACIDKSAAFTLKIIALFSILITSIIGVSLPLLTKNIQALQPDRDIFTIVKSFAAGIILATGFMHVLPDSFEMLSSSCLPEYPWHKFPFTGFVAMLSAILALMVDSLSTSFYNKKKREEKGGNITSVSSTSNGDMERGTSNGNVVHLHNHSSTKMVETTETTNTQLLRYRIIAMVLEIGIIVHSVVIGLSLGASNNVCTIKPLVAALCFHQMFEGMGLGGCILQADYKLLKKTIMVIFFSITTPSGIILGLVIAKAYTEDSSTSLITEGILNAASAGLLIYMALVDLLSADFMGAKLQGNIKLQIKSYIAVLLGSGGMSLMAKWA